MRGRQGCETARRADAAAGSIHRYLGTHIATRAEALSAWSGQGCDVKSFQLADARATVFTPDFGILTLCHRGRKLFRSTRYPGVDIIVLRQARRHLGLELRHQYSGPRQFDLSPEGSRWNAPKHFSLIAVRNGRVGSSQSGTVSQNGGGRVLQPHGNCEFDSERGRGLGAPGNPWRNRGR